MAKKNHKPFGGFLDFNHNGKIEPWELWMVNKMLNNSANTDSDIDDFGIVPDIDSDIDMDEDIEDVCLESKDAEASSEEEYEWRENCSDGSEHGISPDDFETEMDYMTALEDAEEERYEWRNHCPDESEYGVSPEDYETVDEYVSALIDAALGVIIKPVISVEFEPKETGIFNATKELNE